jgi:hypothetical protein
MSPWGSENQRKDSQIMASDPDNGPPRARHTWRRSQLWLFGFLLSAAVLLGLLNVYAWVEQRTLPKGSDLEAPETLSFDGPSQDLNNTIVVPSLERPVPDGKSALWCATFQSLNTLRAGSFAAIWLTQQATGEETLQVLPAFLGDEVRLRGHVALSVGCINNDSPAEPWNVFIMGVLKKTHHAHAFADPESMARVPGEPLALGRGVEPLNDNDLIADLPVLNDTHVQSLG